MDKPTAKQAQNIWAKTQKAFENGDENAIIESVNEQINFIGKVLRHPDITKKQAIIYFNLLTSDVEND